VKTIGDAVMATFETPDRAIAAAIRMREAMSDLGAERQHQSLRLKMGIHEGSCLAVTLNGQQDYFGQTINIASRVQGLAASRSIMATEQVVANTRARALLDTNGLTPTLRRVELSGIADKVSVYEID
jgi:class 3 adenylate cyclase